MLIVERLEKRFGTGALVLGGIDLSVDLGEIVAIVGGSGCGKSTLLRILTGLDTPSAGQVSIDGEPILAPHPRVGIVFQEPRLFPWLTVAQNVGFGIAHLPVSARDRRVAAVLERVGLAEKAGVWPRQLSGGQAQRVAIARALVTEPEVLLLDEPFSALDAFTRADLQEHLLDIWARTAPRPTLVVVTHDVDEAIILADRVVVMEPNPGRIAATLNVDLPRPRSRTDAAFDGLRHEVLSALDRTLPRGR
jgi:sulfonate transport system ATP-binding protein